MTARPPSATCLHCQIGVLLRAKHPDGKISMETIRDIAQVLSEIVALEPNRDQRLADLETVFAIMRRLTEDLAANRKKRLERQAAFALDVMTPKGSA
ncbi:MAG TPA: hypothetical protein EYP07_08845 [Kiloniellaceae bacterium]|nr:hypothetical protein [Kiloniellaceae bacterium]